MFKTIINAWKVPEVRKRLLFTILLLIIFRFGTHVSVPFVNFARLDGVMNTANNGLLGMINLITGGAFARLSVFAMSISPYISASIIVQLLGMLIPSLEMMMKEGGEQGKQKINRYTKIITFILALIQGAGLYIAYSKQGLFVNPGWMTGITVVMSFLAGTAFLVWLGEKITKNGIGNGISMLIFAGIVASLPNSVIRLVSRNNIFCRTNKCSKYDNSYSNYDRCNGINNCSSICTYCRKKNTSTIFKKNSWKKDVWRTKYIYTN